jgi:predicted nucleic acid-binding protein
MPARVIDASALAAVIFGEPESAAVLAVLDGDDIVAPTLLGYELANIARTKSIRYPERRELFAQALRKGLALNIQWIEVNHGDALELALRLNLTCYDASYILIARSLGIPLITLDHRQRAAISQN